MIEKFIKAWAKNEKRLEDNIEKNEKYEEGFWEHDFNYKDLLVLLIEEVINPELDDYKKLDTENITEIDDGDYQGTQIYLIPEKTYQPYINEYIITHNYYGSCSGCDALLAAENVKHIKRICLNLLQNMKWLEENN